MRWRYGRSSFRLSPAVAGTASRAPGHSAEESTCSRVRRLATNEGGIGGLQPGETLVIKADVAEHVSRKVCSGSSACSRHISISFSARVVIRFARSGEAWRWIMRYGTGPETVVDVALQGLSSICLAPIA